ncbi:MAG: hypothetical protein KAS18_07065 [Calditrichia bacterium]|nr:hypothetical protein [Calditrichia bacterium]
MPANPFDLKQLIYLIKDNKDFDANLILDEGCRIATEDPKPLIKVLNYLINYLKQLTQQPLEISLDLREKDYLLSLMAYTDTSDLPAISDQLDEALATYNAIKNVIHEKDKYIQFKVSFAK